MARVFISHASCERALAGEVFGWLVGDGHELFYDQDLRTGLAVGERWEPRLFERLRWADALVCLVTSAYVASVWCTAELTTAINHGSRVLPLLAEAGVVHPLLTGVQFGDHTADPDAAQAALAEALRRVAAAGGHGWADGRSPYPGLRAFDTDLQRAFFGRRQEVQDLAGLVRSPAERADQGLLVVTGPSGCGKSSLLRAGLIPVMAEEPDWWTLPAVLPGADPVAALAREITGAGRDLGLDWALPQLRVRLEKDPAAVVDELLLATPGIGQQRRRLLMVIDQFEELLTLTPAAERARFAALLRTLAPGPVVMVASLRPEFLAALLANPELACLPIRTFALRPLTTQALPEVIQGPATLAGIGVDTQLVAKLVTDTGTGEALPLLAFTLQQLAVDATRGGHLSVDRYRLLGGVQGALTSQADAALTDAATATGRSPDQVIASLLRMVTVDEQGQPTRTRVPLDQLPDDVRTELGAFATRRLLTTDTENGVVVVGVAHEAFLTVWEPLAEAITAAGTALRTRRAVEHAAVAWDNDGRNRGRLWERGQLAGALNDLDAPATGRRRGSGPPDPATPAPGRRWVRRPRLRQRGNLHATVALSAAAQEFLRASIRVDRRRRTRTITALSLLLVGALALTTFAITQQRTAQEQQRVAVAGQRLATAGQLLAQSAAIRGTDPLTAARLALAADRLNPDSQTRNGLLNDVIGPLKYSLTGHTGMVISVAFSPDGRTLATASADHTMILWDLTDPHRPTPIGQPLTGHTDTVQSVAFSPDGRTLATGSDDHTVILWNITDLGHPTPSGEPLTGHTNAVYAVAFSPDGHTLATGSLDKTVILWNVTDPAHPALVGEPLTGHTDAAYAVAFSPDGHTLATGSLDKTVILWDVSDVTHPGPIGEPVSGHTDRVLSVAFSPDGRTLATGSSDQTAILWDIADLGHPTPIGAPLYGHYNRLESVAFSPDGRTLATGSADHTVILWNITDPDLPTRIGQPLIGHTSVVTLVAFSPDGHTLATGSGDHTVILWNLTDPSQPGQIGQPLTGHTGLVASVAVGPDGHTLASGGKDETVILSDITDPTQPEKIGQTPPGHSGTIWSVAVSPDGRTLATGSDDHTVILWNITDPTRPQRLGDPLGAHTDAVSSVAFSPDGRTLATGSTDHTVILWNVGDPAHPRQLGNALDAHNNAVQPVAFSPDGRTLATGSTDHTVILWDVTDPQRPSQIGNPLTGHNQAVYSVAFSPDGRTLATGSDDSTVILWDVTDRAQPARVGQPLTGHTGLVYSVAFSPDGRTLATGSGDGSVILWDVTDPAHPAQIGQPLKHGGVVLSVAFSPDGQTLATGSYDGSVNLWNLTTMIDLRDHLVDRTCTIVGQGLTQDEWTRYIPGLTYQDTC